MMGDENNIPSMTSTKVHDYLEDVGSKWTGQGVAMELGCWLGGSSAPLLKGLVAAGYDKTFWAFDKWRANREQVDKAGEDKKKLMVNQPLDQLYLANVFQIYRNITPVKGVMAGSLKAYNGGPIEICIFDAPKKDPVFGDCVRMLHKHWIPGVTIFGLLDYNFFARFEGVKRKQLMAPVEFIERYKNHFEIVKEWEDETPVFFRYVKEIKNLRK